MSIVRNILSHAPPSGLPAASICTFHSLRARPAYLVELLHLQLTSIKGVQDKDVHPQLRPCRPSPLEMSQVAESEFRPLLGAVSYLHAFEHELKSCYSRSKCGIWRRCWCVACFENTAHVSHVQSCRRWVLLRYPDACPHHPTSKVLQVLSVFFRRVYGVCLPGLRSSVFSAIVDHARVLREALRYVPSLPMSHDHLKKLWQQPGLVCCGM